MTNILWLGDINKKWKTKRVKDVTIKEISNISKKSKEKITFLPMTLVNSDGTYDTDNILDAKNTLSDFK